MRLLDDQGRQIWVAYAMNVHPGGDAAALDRALDETVVPLRARLGVVGTLGIALRLSAHGVQELLGAPARLRALGERFAALDLLPFSGNAFVHGAFHEKGVKESVYAPAWGGEPRTNYTLGFARLLAAWNEPGAEVSLSAAPGSWRGWGEPAQAEHERARAIAACAAGLRDLASETGVQVRLGLEPEPGCTLETTGDVLDFFTGPLARALESAPGAQEYVGLCYDVCHQAVMHEDGPEALRRLAGAGIRIVKLQASSALEVPDPSDPRARAALARYDEPVYLHQVAVANHGGRPTVVSDLGLALATPELSLRRPWRVHFHVPVFRAQSTPPLQTTQAELRRTLHAALASGQARHIEIETYTWDVLLTQESPASGRMTLVEALAQEYEWTLKAAAEVGVTTAPGEQP